MAERFRTQRRLPLNLPRSAQRQSVPRPSAEQLESVLKKALERDFVGLDEQRNALAELDALFEEQLDGVDEKQEKRVAAFVAGTQVEREDIILEAIDAVQDEHRRALVEELSKLTFASPSHDLNKFSAKVQSQKVSLDCIGQSDTRRDELIAAVKQVTGSSFPQERSGLKICAYDAALLMGGLDEYERFHDRTARLREATKRLFAKSDLCDSLDTSLLCLAHSDLKSTGLVTAYRQFDFDAEPFLGVQHSDGRSFMQAVYNKHSVDFERKALPWQGYGDHLGRICRAQFFRVVEEMLHVTSTAGYKELQNEFKDVLRVVDGGRMTGDVLMEMYNGELAAEMIAIFWRVLNNDVAIGAPNPGKMPPLPAYAQTGKAGTFEDLFTLKSDASPKCRARAYVRRVMYTSIANSWFLHCGVAPIMACALERAAGTIDYAKRSVLYDDLEIDPNDKLTTIVTAHRDVGIRVADGRATAQAKNMRAQGVVNSFRRTRSPRQAAGRAEKVKKNNLFPSSTGEAAGPKATNVSSKNVQSMAATTGVILPMLNVNFGWAPQDQDEDDEDDEDDEEEEEEEEEEDSFEALFNQADTFVGPIQTDSGADDGAELQDEYLTTASMTHLYNAFKYIFGAALVGTFIFTVYNDDPLFIPRQTLLFSVDAAFLLKDGAISAVDWGLETIAEDLKRRAAEKFDEDLTSFAGPTGATVFYTVKDLVVWVAKSAWNNPIKGIGFAALAHQAVNSRRVKDIAKWRYRQFMKSLTRELNARRVQIQGLGIPAADTIIALGNGGTPTGDGIDTSRATKPIGGAATQFTNLVAIAEAATLPEAATLQPVKNEVASSTFSTEFARDFAGQDRALVAQALGSAVPRTMQKSAFARQRRPPQRSAGRKQKERSTEIALMALDTLAPMPELGATWTLPFDRPITKAAPTEMLFPVAWAHM